MVIMFAGHRNIYFENSVALKVREVLEEYLIQENFIHFYCGDYGDFDRLCVNILNDLRTTHRNFEVVCVLPYLAGKKITNDERHQKKYDAFLYPPIEKCPPKYAILKRNKWMVEQSDLIISYVIKPFGGAYQTLAFGRKRSKEIINLAPNGANEFAAEVVDETEKACYNVDIKNEGVLERMVIRRAEKKDISRIEDLLSQVNMVHHIGRPDLFNIGRKYTTEQIEQIISNDKTPVFVALDREETVVGYAFCIFEQIENDNIRIPVKTLYIDDLCVDEKSRGQHIGRALYDYTVSFAKESGCYNLTLNVWECNPSAKAFYEKCGLLPQKTYLEHIL